MNPSQSLTQEEIDALLSAVHSGTVTVTPGSAEAVSQAVRYNFRRPSRVSKEQLRSLLVLHEDFAKHVSASLSGMVRAIVDIDVEAVEQISYSEYIMAIPTPTCAFVFNMEPLKGGAVLEINPNLGFVLMDRLLGGQGQGVPTPRDLTEIERAVVERVGLRAMVDLQQAWQQVGAFTFRVLNLETNPQFLQVTSPNEVIMVATFRLKIGDAVGGMTLGYPYLLLESIIDRLGAQRWMPTGATGATADSRAFVVRELGHSSLTVRALLGGAHVTVRNLLGLRPGQVLPLTAPREHPVRVLLNDVPKFAGRLGTHRTNLAVQILGPLGEEDHA